ncbi:MAG: ROK family protein [bacterium]|nr:ROK family protein [bacterium]
MSSRYVLGLDIGGTNLKLGLVSETGELVDHVIATTPLRREPEDVVSAAEHACRPLLARVRHKPEGIGIAAAGMIDLSGEILLSGPNFPTWTNVPLRADIERVFGIPAAMGNDVDAFGLAEFRWGAGVGLKNFVCAAVGTGVGGAVFIDGKLYRGAFGGAGEVGFTVISPDGPVVLDCPGVIEGYVGRKGFDEIVLKLFPTGEVPTPRRITELAAEGDARARQVHSRLAEYLAEAAASWIALLNPEALILGGGTLAGADFFFEEFERILKIRARRTHVEKLKILPSKLGYFAGVQGAAAVWLASRGL